MSETRTEMYQTVREALEFSWIKYGGWPTGGHFALPKEDRENAIATLAALEAQEREAPKCQHCEGRGYTEEFMGHEFMAGWCKVKCPECATPPAAPESPKYAIQIPEKYDPEKSYPPAPPAGECAALSAIAVAAIPLETIGNEIRTNERAHPQMCLALKASILVAQDAVRGAALASPCCEGLREELANVRYDLDEATAGQREAVRINLERSKLMEGLDAELSDAKIEIARLTAELEKEQRGHSNTVEAAGDALGELAAELRQAVDALRDYRDEVSMTHEQWHERISEIVAAYDAKHGEKQ